MRWISSRVLTVLGFLCLLCVGQPEPKRLGVYTPQASQLVPVLDLNNTEYASLADILAPLGRADSRLDGKKWKLRFDDREAQFTPGKTKARINKRDVELAAPFELDNNRGLVPLASLPAMLAQLLPKHTVVFHAEARRLLIDNPELRYSAELHRNSGLVLTFSAPVNPTIATEPGHLRMVFTREPLSPNGGSDTQIFPDPTIPALRYLERNGAAELVVSGNAALLASFSADRRTITIAPVAPPKVAQAPPTPAAAVVPPPSTTAPAAVQGPKYVIVIDAAHGGEDRGATLSPTLAEKDVALAFARRLHRELEARGLASRLVRDADVNLTPEQRAAAANAAGPALYISVHATTTGTGVHLFASSLPRAASHTVAFLPWDTAQAYYVDASQNIAAALEAELRKHDVPALKLAASLHPLNNIAGPAIAIEVAAPRPGGIDELNSPPYQSSVCSALAGGIAASHLRWSSRGGAR